MTTDSTETVETYSRVGFGILASYPEQWAWEVWGKNGHAWGTDQSEREAMLECVSYLQTHYL